MQDNNQSNFNQSNIPAGTPNQDPNFNSNSGPNQPVFNQPQFNQTQYYPNYNNGYNNQEAPQNPENNLDSPRRLSLFVVFAKTFLGLAGGVFSSLIMLLIFLGASGILQPVLSPAESSGETSPIFIVILMAMVFITCLVSSLLSPLLLSYTERSRYPRITTALYQIFILNLVIFAFTAPIYLTTSTTSLELTAYAAGLQIVLISTGSALIMEILNDLRYPLLAVYSTIIGVLVATTANLFIYQFFKNATVLLFTALPITWASIGFFQATLTMIYYWYYINWGNDFLAISTSYGVDYAGVAQEEEEAEQPMPEDKSGSDFLKS